MKKILHIGIDDTDSLKGSCTTHIATIIINEITTQANFLDFPNLIRLNPNIPFKTRGNGSVAIRIDGEKIDLDNVCELVLKKVKCLAKLEDENTNPGVVFLTNSIPSKVKEFSKRAMWDVISISDAEKFNLMPNIELIKFGNGRGIIGALAAIGNQLNGDFTYEHLTYRSPEKYGTKRLVERESIIAADKATSLTFNNIDYDYNSIMITPRGADPVFTGIRGETAEEVMKAWSIIKPLEKITMKMIFRTNQHTNQHFVKKFKINELKPHLSIITRGKVSCTPFYIDGSHLIFSISDETGEIDCAAYEPTKKFRGELSNLIIGDEVTVFGGIRPSAKEHPLTINIERLRIEALEELFSFENPFCEICKARLKSAGKNKGYKCPKCSSVFRNKKQIKRQQPRKLQLKEYLPPIIAHRHLTRPKIRDNRDNTNKKMSKIDVNRALNHLISSSI